MAKAQYSAKDKKFSAVVSFGESLKLVDPLGISGLIIQQHNISFSMSKKAGKSVALTIGLKTKQAHLATNLRIHFEICLQHECEWTCVQHCHIS